MRLPSFLSSLHVFAYVCMGYFLFDRMDFCWWLLAWERYALAAAATGQMPFTTAMQHKLTVTSVAQDQMAEGRSTQIAVLYDEVVRCTRMASYICSVARYSLFLLAGGDGKVSAATWVTPSNLT